MLEDFQNIDLFSPSIFDIAGNMLVAFVCGIIIAVVYRMTYNGPSYSPTFVNSLVLLAMITAVVILTIGNNLARAFGLVGAMSIIRFRTAVRDVQDIIFIFFSLTIGMAAGVGLTLVAVMATLLVSAVILLLVATNFGKPPKKQHLLQLSYAGNPEAEAEVKEILRKHARKIRLVNLKNVGTDGTMSAFYNLTLRNDKKSELFLRDLQQLDYVQNVNLYFEEDSGGITP
ncbi:MAG: putative membrane protein YhiD involved in acid resistance [Saprospiraceae bacterium]|jgi:uncharacterized membrane protein YhiD involved in acid resistance